MTICCSFYNRRMLLRKEENTNHVIAWISLELSYQEWWEYPSLHPHQKLWEELKINRSIEVFEPHQIVTTEWVSRIKITHKENKISFKIGIWCVYNTLKKCLTLNNLDLSIIRPRGLEPTPKIIEINVKLVLAFVLSQHIFPKNHSKLNWGKQ